MTRRPVTLQASNVSRKSVEAEGIGICIGIGIVFLRVNAGYFRGATGHHYAKQKPWREQRMRDTTVPQAYAGVSERVAVVASRR